MKYRNVRTHTPKEHLKNPPGTEDILNPSEEVQYYTAVI